MARFLFTSAPLMGHLDWGGYLRTAAALVRMGHDVTWVSAAAVAPPVTAAGVPITAVDTPGWRVPPPRRADLPPAERARQRQARAIDGWLDVAEVARGLHAMQRVVASARPDVIVSELFVTAAPLLAEKHGVPLVIAGWPALAMTAAGSTTDAQQVAQVAQARLQQLWDHAQVSGRYWPNGSFWPVSPHGHVVYFSRDWYGETAALLPYNRFVGGQAAPPAGSAPAWMADLPADRPLVLITLGSLFTHDDSFFARAVQAVLSGAGCPIVAAGSPELAVRLRAQLPTGAIIQAWVAYDWLLPRLSLVIHHGGVGTTHAAIVHGVPQLIVPRAGDQANQARRAAAAGIGLSLAPAHATADRLALAVNQLLDDPQWRARAGHWRDEFARLGGVDQAAHWLSQL